MEACYLLLKTKLINIIPSACLIKFILNQNLSQSSRRITGSHQGFSDALSQTEAFSGLSSMPLDSMCCHFHTTSLFSKLTHCMRIVPLRIRVSPRAFFDATFFGQIDLRRAGILQGLGWALFPLHLLATVPS